MCRYYFLGNTCYMNSMLQCFAQLPPLTTPFRDGTYKAMVNRNNSFGTEGMPELDKRWLAIAKTDLQKGFMAATRSVAKPDFF